MNVLITSFRLFFATIVVVSLLYPLSIWGIADGFVAEKSQGSLIRDRNGKLVGSRLIAQRFTSRRYFWPRPSAVDYDASATGGSNLSPTSKAITERAEATLAQYALKGGNLLPADLATTSGSGIDPHVTLRAAMLQVPRVAEERSLTSEQVEALVNSNLDSPTLSLLGEESLVNVLLLNMSLDQLSSSKDDVRR